MGTLFDSKSCAVIYLVHLWVNCLICHKIDVKSQSITCTAHMLSVDPFDTSLSIPGRVFRPAPPVNTWPPLLPHSQRTCLRCSSTVVDDEAHCLFMCEHPTIVEARDLFLAAVVPPVAALSSLRYADFWALSATGCVPLSALVKYVAVCVRVCWYCHQSGGTDVVDLPDILLPAGQYLDMFDSESETDVPSDSSDEELVEV